MNTGGPAFPTEYFYDHETNYERMPTEGMTLRDYFAAKAMQAFITSNHSQDEVNRYDEILVSKQSYLLADYMLEARK